MATYTQYNPVYQRSPTGYGGDMTGGGGGVPSWLPILLAGAGSFMSARSQNQAANAQNQRTAGNDALLTQFLAGLTGTPATSGARPDRFRMWGGTLPTFANNPATPPSLDQLGMQLFNSDGSNPTLDALQNFQAPGVPNVYRDLGLATDPILQSMRNGPNDAALSSNLLDILGGNTNFDTSIVSSALDPIRQRNLARQVAELQASAPGLGSRFGSAIRRGEVDLRRQNLEDTTAIDAQLSFQAHEAAQQRRLAAANELLGLGNLQLGRDNSALSALLGQAGVGIQQGQLGLQQGRLGLDALLGAGNLGVAQQSQRAQALQLLMQNRTNNNQQYLQGLGLMYGQPVASGPGYGGAITDVGQLMLMMQLANQGRA